MDKARARFLLECYRPAGGDEGDPIFAEALRMAKADPELAAWFEKSRGFDAAMGKSLRSLPVASGLREDILLNARVPRETARRPGLLFRMFWELIRLPMGAVAAVLAAVFLIGWLARAPQAGEKGLAIEAIRYSKSMPSLQFVCFDSKAVGEWINSQPNAREIGFTMNKAMPSMSLIGSSSISWNGKPVMMMCLQNGHEMAMLYVVRGSDFQVKDCPGCTMRKDGWVSKLRSSGEKTFVLTTTASADAFEMPF